MKTFDYTVKDELGIHARPAGLLVKEAKNFTSKITIKKFVRFETGEGLEKKQENFAEEVAKQIGK